MQAIAILVSRIKVGSKDRVIAKLGWKWSWIHNYEHSLKGRIWIGWDAFIVYMMVTYSFEQVPSVDIRDRAKSLSCSISFVYGLHTIQDKKAMWQTLHNIAPTVGEIG